MHSTCVQETENICARAWRRGGRVLLRACRYLLQETPGHSPALNVTLHLMHQLMQSAERAARLAEKIVPVYRMHQPSLTSPCMLGNPCSVCLAHASCLSGDPCRDCRRGKTLCPKATPAEPAFMLGFDDGLALVTDGLAQFINNQSALRLTFSKVVNLRDISCKINLHVLIAYAEGQPGARAAVDLGWRHPLRGIPCEEWTPEMMTACLNEVRGFAR